MTTAAIQTRELRKNFGQNEVLKGINLDFAPGQVIGLIGTNGAGKSTLIKCLLGLLKRTSGQSTIFGEDSWDLSATAKARLGYVSQEFSVLPWLKVRQACDYTGSFYKNWNRAHVDDLLRDWNLPANKRVGTLSVGQRQKLAVILAMGHQPELLILDEPVASLDPVARRQFLQSLIEFTATGKNTVLFSTHITSDLERIASHVAFLKDGELKYFGELDQLKEDCKRLRIHSSSPLPTNLQIPHTVRSRVDGTHGLVTVSGLLPDTIPWIVQKYGAQVSIEDLNLEEIFLELNGFAAEAHDVVGVN